MKRAAPSKQLEHEVPAGVITSADPLGEALVEGRRWCAPGRKG